MSIGSEGMNIKQSKPKEKKSGIESIEGSVVKPNYRPGELAKIKKQHREKRKRAQALSDHLDVQVKGIACCPRDPFMRCDGDEVETLKLCRLLVGEWMDDWTIQVFNDAKKPVEIFKCVIAFVRLSIAHELNI